MKRATVFISALLLWLLAEARAAPLADPVAGPVQVCFNYTSFYLAEGERITAFEGGMEAVEITVEGANGAYRIMESEILSPPRLGRLLLDREGTRVYRAKYHKREYAIAGVTNFSGGESGAIVLLRGEALTGDAPDAQVYERVRVRDPGPLHCLFTFSYSWDVFLPDE